MVQELLITEIERLSKEKRDNNLFEKFISIEKQFEETDNIRELRNELYISNPEAKEYIQIIYAKFDDVDPSIIENFEKIKRELKNQFSTDEINLEDLLIGKNGDHFGPIIKKLLSLGINPLGVGKEMETFVVDDEPVAWFKLFDLKTNNIDLEYLQDKTTLQFHFQNLDEDSEGRNAQSEISVGAGSPGYENKIIKAISSYLKLFIAKEPLFKKFVYGIENSGIGYAVFKKELLDNVIDNLPEKYASIKIEKEHLYNLFNSILRVCGNNYYYRDQEYGKRGFKNWDAFNLFCNTETGLTNANKIRPKGNSKLVELLNIYAINTPFTLSGDDGDKRKVIADIVFSGLSKLFDTTRGKIKNGTQLIDVHNNDNTGYNFIWHINLDNLAIKIVDENSTVYRTESNRRVHLFHTHSSTTAVLSGNDTISLSFSPGLKKL